MYDLGVGSSSDEDPTAFEGGNMSSCCWGDDSPDYGPGPGWEVAVWDGSQSSSPPSDSVAQLDNYMFGPSSKPFITPLPFIESPSFGGNTLSDLSGLQPYGSNLGFLQDLFYRSNSFSGVQLVSDISYSGFFRASIHWRHVWDIFRLHRPNRRKTRGNTGRASGCSRRWFKQFIFALHKHDPAGDWLRKPSLHSSIRQLARLASAA